MNCRRAPVTHLAVAVLSLCAAACEKNEQSDLERVTNTDNIEIHAEEPLSCVYMARQSGKNPTDEQQQMQDRGECATLGSDGSVAVHAEHLGQLFFRDGLAWLFVRGRGWHYVTPEGRTAAVIEFDNGPDYFEEGLARTRRGGKIGFIDTGLSEAIAPQWDYATPFDNGVAAVCRGCSAVPTGDGEHSEVQGGVWGFINRDGVEIVPVRFERDRLPQPPSVK